MIKKNKNLFLGGVTVVAFGAALVFAVLGIVENIEQIDTEIAARETGFVLASAKEKETVSVSLPVMYFDQNMNGCVNLGELREGRPLDELQLEWMNCEYVASTLQMNYEMSDRMLSYGSLKFYPLSAEKNGTASSVNNDENSKLFTMILDVPLTVQANGEERFEIGADDETYVFVDDKLVIDMGGIHDATGAEFLIDETGKVYVGYSGAEMTDSGIILEPGATTIKIFHANREAADSIFGVRFIGMNHSFVEAKLAKSEISDGVQVAYASGEDMYAAPLGVTETTSPNNASRHIVMMTVFGIAAVVLVALVAVTVRIIVKQMV